MKTFSKVLLAIAERPITTVQAMEDRDSVSGMMDGHLVTVRRSLSLLDGLPIQNMSVIFNDELQVYGYSNYKVSDEEVKVFNMMFGSVRRIMDNLVEERKVEAKGYFKAVFK